MHTTCSMKCLCEDLLHFVTLAFDVTNIWLELHAVTKSYGNWYGKHLNCTHVGRTWLGYGTYFVPQFYNTNNVQMTWNLSMCYSNLNTFICLEIVLENFDVSWWHLWVKVLGRSWVPLEQNARLSQVLLVIHIFVIWTLFWDIFYAFYTPTVYTCTLKQVWGICAAYTFFHAFISIYPLYMA